MTWKTIRLELARTAGFPTGSPGRAYIMRLPLNAAGQIDDALLAQYPSRATARRFWASEADQFGHVERADGHYVLQCDSDAATFRLPAASILLPGQIVELEGPDGAPQPFRVASIKSGTLNRTVES